MKKNLVVIFFLVLFHFILECHAQQWINISPFPDSNIGISGNFISADEGWIEQRSSTVEQAIYHTVDGGKNWEKIYSLEDSLEILTSTVMVDSLNGWGRKIWQNNQYPYNSKTYYIRTRNGGYSWEDMTDYIPDVLKISSFYFKNNNVGFLCCGTDTLTYNALIYKTIDGGYNWYLTETPIIGFPFGGYENYIANNFFFVNENCGWAACSVAFDAGLVLKTVDGGETWQVAIDSGPDFWDVYFYNENHGGAVGYSWGSTVCLTDNNFNDLTYKYTNWNQYAGSICFQNDSTIWITGDPGIINRSIDHGATFDAYQTIDARLGNLQFFDDIGYVFGYNNALYKFDGQSGIAQELQIDHFILYQNYPNPFNPVTQIRFALAKTSDVKLSVYNVTGQIVAELINGIMNAGSHTALFDGSRLNSGVYYYTLEADGVSVTKKFVLMK